jgi:hypothetical protein
MPTCNPIRFKIALAVAGIHASEWARQQGVSRQMLHAVLKGQRRSKRLTAAMESFVEANSVPNVTPLEGLVRNDVRNCEPAKLAQNRKAA